MINFFNTIDTTAKKFLFVFLTIIFASTIVSVVYGIYFSFFSLYSPLLLNQNIHITLKYLLVSLCECVGGTFFLDYVFRKEKAK